ncbi:MAG: permease prefix domain 1-containing protein [Lachnospiraceae bacterium]|nr:permease prefix domain 1-containing protein [Lachnospiraceae bacterium]
METLRIYLNNMFQSLPDTAEVQRAKDELWQMMEDKYTDLISEGMSENEAVGTVIVEFGNLDDFADLLNIRSLIPYGLPKVTETTDERNENAQYSSDNQDERIPESSAGSAKYGYTANPCRILSVAEAGAYLREMTKTSLLRAIGVFLCITCVTGYIFFGSIGNNIFFFERFFNIIGTLVFWGFIVCGVLLFVWSGRLNERWKYIRKERCVLDPEALSFVTTRYNGVHASSRQFRLIGILLCAFCWVPVAFLSGLGISFLTGSVGSTIMFFFVGAGVGLLVASAGVVSAHKKLLKRDQKIKAEGQVLQ